MIANFPTIAQAFTSETHRGANDAQREAIPRPRSKPTPTPKQKMNTGHLQAERAEKAQQEDKFTPRQTITTNQEQMKSKITPGTWRRGTNTASKEWMQVFRQDGSMIAEVKTIHKRGQRERGDFQEEEANARAIAEVPAMIEALRELKNSIRHAVGCRAPQAHHCTCDADKLWDDTSAILARIEG